MYEDSWYSYEPDSRSHKEDVSSHVTKHGRRESLLKQSNGNDQLASPVEQLAMQIEQENPRLPGPPHATLARRSKSYSDFYDAAMGVLSRKVKSEQPRDRFETHKSTAPGPTVESPFEDFEGGLLNLSHDDFQLYRDQLDLSERHLENVLHDTTSALDLLAGLSNSFKIVESQTASFQGQCEDLLSEQKRLRDLADEIGTDLQYYAYLEPLTRRLNAPGIGRIVRSDDFLDMLKNLNACIEFMDNHSNYRDATVYKTRYTALLERSLSLVQVAFSSALRDVSDDVSKQLKSKDHTETAEYVLLYGKYETVSSSLGTQLEKLFRTREFTYGTSGDSAVPLPYIQQYHEFYKQVVEIYLKNREIVGAMVLKNLRKFATLEPKPEADFKAFARRCVQYAFDICHNEYLLQEKFFQNGPLLAEYPAITWYKSMDYSQMLDDNRLAHLTTLSTFLTTYTSHVDLQRVCDLTNWLETMYSASNESEYEGDHSREDRRVTAKVFLSTHLWPLSDGLFLKAAKEIEFFKPSQNDLQIAGRAAAANVPNEAISGEKGNKVDENIQIYDTSTPAVSNAYPTVKTAVNLLVMYNDGVYDRPRAGDVLYEIVHQATESLQKAATIIKRNSTIMDAQLFLIKNLMLIENLFMTHEIPDSVRQSAEFDFSPIWDTIKELQNRKQLFNPLAYFTPLVKGQLLPAVVDHLLDARKELEKVLVQQITAFTKYWQSRLEVTDKQKRDTVLKASNELDILLNRVFDDETTKGALWKMIRAEQG